ncbi:MAG: HAMP domain-containing protein [Clostridia bacterium]|nr:HAMP domain-containing protein [Clostridia bacterium]
MKPIRLKARLSLAFFLVVAVMFAAISFAANGLLANQFKNYAINKQNQRIETFVDVFASRYVDWGNRWDPAGVESIGVNALSEGFLIRLKDQGGKTLWDAQVHNHGMCSLMLANIAERMQSQFDNFQGGYTEQTRELIVAGESIGWVDIGYYGPYSYSEVDLAFLKRLNQLLLLAAILSMAIAAILGLLIARQLTGPITRAIQTTRRIASGHYTDRLAAEKGPRELSDLTESINSLAESLGRQETMRKQLTNDVAHELRTPLAVLQSHLEAMIDGTWQADQKRLESCHGEVVRISSLVKDLEKLTQIEQGNLSLQKEAVDLQALMQRIDLNFQRDFASKNVQLNIQVDPVVIQGDTDKLSQVFINLLANALKYTNPGGSVRVFSHVTGNQVTVSVADTGNGIAPEDLVQIFERFYRADKSRTRETGGSGIGLAIVKSIVEAHGGLVTVESQPGQGSVFQVTLPLD